MRKHLSHIKGGRLAASPIPRGIVTIAISDVPKDDPSAIGSGPTVPDPTTLADARAIVAKYKLDLPASVIAALADPKNESPKPGDTAFANTQFALAARPADCIARGGSCGACRRLRMRLPGRQCRGRGARGGGGARQARPRTACARQTRGDYFGRRTHRHHSRQRPRRARIRNMPWRWRSRLPACRRVAAVAGDTDGTDGGAGAANDPAGALLMATRWRAPRRSASIPPRFLPTIIQRVSSPL